VWKVVVDAAGAGAAYNEIVSAIQNRSVTEVAIFGYSHGGGSTHDLSNRLHGNRGQIGTFTIVFTSYVDAVRNGSNQDIRQETRRPPGSQYHINHYQHGVLNPLSQFRDAGLDGGPTDAPGADFELDVETTGWGANATHYTVDDFEQVKSQIIGDLNDKTER
jgi:hypothetical protein